MNKTSAILQSLGFSYRQTEFNFPTCEKPFSLAAKPLVQRQTNN